MKHSRRHTHSKTVAPKGDRLQWDALSKAKPVLLTPELTKGRLLSEKDLEKRANAASGSTNVLVP